MVVNEEALMWVEKYRPKTLTEVVGLKDIVESLQAFMRNPKAMPHLMFAGVPGTGKTTLALAIARTLYGANWKSFTLELNASDERGIDTVRDRIKDFSRYSRTGFGDVIPFALIILDECDQMTGPAQTALRRIMEVGSRTSRFILICNQSSKIIEPIQSRCAIFRFSRVDKQAMKQHLICLAEKEGYTLIPEAADRIVDFAEGDLRHAINALQTASAYKEGVIDEKTVSLVIGEASPSQVQKMIRKALYGDFMEARKTMYDIMGSFGFSGTEIIRQVQREIFKMSDLTAEQKADLSSIIGEYDYRITQGANSDIQLSALLAQFAKFGKGIEESYAETK
ncbi:MAG: replication factor C small subunit [Nitrososphaerota archaeon]|jgi:replication factor C small subunit|nr:replication factor C small subunit [Nitrososphaerota archaeon]